jgi:hypothetical protein
MSRTVATTTKGRWTAREQGLTLRLGFVEQQSARFVLWLRCLRDASIEAGRQDSRVGVCLYFLIPSDRTSTKQTAKFATCHHQERKNEKWLRTLAILNLGYSFIITHY